MAKWLQVTVHLQNGHTHSCHHPRTHLVPLDELKKDPSALHNTQHKMKARQQMLEGIRPKECRYCWNIEDLPGNHISDRIIKSNDPWAQGRIQEIAQMPWNKKINPTYLEVSFSSVCNFKCSYCGPAVSSKWFAEAKKFGAYPTDNRVNGIEGLKIQNKIPIPENKNPYVDGFWEWWPSLKKDLKVLRITGGEPLLSKNTFKVLDSLVESPQPHLELIVNSNLGVPYSITSKFADQAAQLLKQGAVKKLLIYTSLDTFGPQAEYIRHGLDLALFEKNLDLLLERVPTAPITFMCTFNILSIPSFGDFLRFLIEKKKMATRQGGAVTLDLSYLEHPQFLSVRIGEPEDLEKMHQHLALMKSFPADDPERGCFNTYEFIKMERVIDFMERMSFKDVEQRNYWSDFYAFFKEHDRRRGTDFLAVFPEKKAFYQKAKKAYYEIFSEMAAAMSVTKSSQQT
jgi:organic radical activating enzyme